LLYKGDITPNFPEFSFAQGGGNIFFRYNPTKAFTLRTNLLIGRIYGDDKLINEPQQQIRKLNFSTGISEIAVTGEYNFLDYQLKKNVVDWTPYVFGGIGYLSFSPNTTRTIPYKTSGIVIPFGVGLKWRVKGPWNLGVEFGTRKTFTDNLDNIINDTKRSKINQSDYATGDMYYYTAVTLSYTFYKIYCPD
jgi:hypothetical protein